ncbi:MAG: hypothetical protein EA367_17550 [Leptolyngbya sp. DLM2.Bin15]|nr:MAG: hypothetical protein EA367_17550 [Leptolyngbya sp. DLM2.Bin15]
MGWMAPAMAQACPYATVRLETERSVDADLLCQAAQPWSNRGFQVLIYVTDQASASEDAWFDHLDQVEANAGLRDLSQNDVFARDGLSFAASTGNPRLWAATVTYGEKLYDRPIDRSPQMDDIKRQVHQQIGIDPTLAMAEFLTATYEVNYAVSPAGKIAAGVFGLGGVGVTAGLLARRRRNVRQLQQQLADLQSRVATLLMAGEYLFSGDQPQNMPSYQLFVASGGDRYPNHAQQLEQLLSQCRASLDEAFLIHHQLTETTSTPIVEQITAWEQLYVQWVGSRPSVMALSDEQLRTLLNPMQMIEQPQGALAQQFYDLRQQLDGRPLQMKLMFVDPEMEHIDGILGYLEDIKRLILRLQTAPQEAPKALQRLQDQRLTLLDRLNPVPGINLTPLVTLIDEQLQNAERELHSDRALDALDTCDRIQANLDTVQQLVEAIALQRQQEATVQQWMAQGYRYPDYTTYRAAMDGAIATLETRIAGGQWEAIAASISTIQLGSETLLKGMEQRVEQHKQLNTQIKTYASRLASQQNRWKRCQEATVPYVQQTAPLYKLHQPTATTVGLTLQTVNQLLGEAQNLHAEVTQTSVAPENLDQAVQAMERLETISQQVEQHLQEINQVASSLRQEEERCTPPAFMFSHESSSYSSSSSSSGSSSRRSSSSSSRSYSSGSSSRRASSGGSSRRSSSGGSSRRSSSGGSSRRR